MQVISVCFDIYTSEKIRIICLSQQIHLICERKVFLQIWIIQIIYISLIIRITYSVKKHDLCSSFTINIRDKMQIFINPIPVQVNNHVYLRVLRQHIRNLLLSVGICLASVKLSLHHVKFRIYMYHLKSIFFFKKLCKVVAHLHYRHVTSCGIRKCFL